MTTTTTSTTVVNMNGYRKGKIFVSFRAATLRVKEDNNFSGTTREAANKQTKKSREPRKQTKNHRHITIMTSSSTTIWNQDSASIGFFLFCCRIVALTIGYIMTTCRTVVVYCPTQQMRRFVFPSSGSIWRITHSFRNRFFLLLFFLFWCLIQKARRRKREEKKTMMKEASITKKLRTKTLMPHPYRFHMNCRFLSFCQ